MLQRLLCDKGCCELKTETYTHNRNYPHREQQRRRKAGVFIYDPDSEKILLVHSRGHFWGIPKGSLNFGEDEIDCAIREVKEETGLDIDSTNFQKSLRIFNRAVYFYTEMPEKTVEIQSHIENNDANGVGWVKSECLENFIKQGKVSINQHCRIAFSKFQEKYFSYSGCG